MELIFSHLLCYKQAVPTELLCHAAPAEPCAYRKRINYNKLRRSFLLNLDAYFKTLTTVTNLLLLG